MLQACLTFLIYFIIISNAQSPLRAYYENIATISGHSGEVSVNYAAENEGLFITGALDVLLSL